LLPSGWPIPLRHSTAGFGAFLSEKRRLVAPNHPKFADIVGSLWDFNGCDWNVYLVGGLEHFFMFPFSWECHNPN
jgi:hypothetical protein